MVLEMDFCDHTAKNNEQNVTSPEWNKRKGYYKISEKVLWSYSKERWTKPYFTWIKQKKSFL